VGRRSAGAVGEGQSAPPGSIRTADILGALSLAGDMAMELPAGHAIRSCFIGMRIADQLALSQDQEICLYYSELLMDVGCTSWASQLAASIMGDEQVARRELYFHCDTRKATDVLSWLLEYMAVGAPPHVRARRIWDFTLHGKEYLREALTNTAEVAGRFAQRLGMPDEVRATLWTVFEQWDGTGPHGARGNQVPIISGIVNLTSLVEAFYSFGGRAAAIRMVQGRRGKAFDPAIVDAFLSATQKEDFWAGLEDTSVWTRVRETEPPSRYRYLDQAKLEDIALAFADFADLKSFYSVGHSRRVGALTRRIASRLALPPSAVQDTYLGALTHDIGLVAVPSFTLHKPEAEYTPGEWERLRLHPYFGERILSRIPCFESIARLVATHHEQPDGRGYYRGIPGSQVPIGARVIAIADRFDELTHAAPGREPLDPEDALRRMETGRGTGLDPDALDSLTEELGVGGPMSTARKTRPTTEWPAHLTDREVEILRLLAAGPTRREVAARLFLSEHTVRHHMEHIYNKIGVNTRVAATLFAVEHGLLP
jgi:HD-GYP domain-containing protein (c-di-GMP phosphodiesterase class II)/DNA-binding CsgD family transcriptional regulator